MKQFGVQCSRTYSGFLTSDPSTLKTSAERVPPPFFSEREREREKVDSFLVYSRGIVAMFLVFYRESVGGCVLDLLCGDLWTVSLLSVGKHIDSFSGFL